METTSSSTLPNTSATLAAVICETVNHLSLPIRLNIYLRSSSNDSPNRVQHSQTRMAPEVRSGGRLLEVNIHHLKSARVSKRNNYLISIAKRAIKPIRISDQENAEEDGNPIRKGDIRSNGLDALHARTLLA